LRKLRHIGLLLWGLGIACSGHAQGNTAFSNLRRVVLDASQPLHRIDSLSVWQASLQVLVEDGSALREGTHYRLRDLQWLLLDTARLRRDFPDCEQVTAVFRVLPYALHAPVRRLDTLAIRRRADAGKAIEYDYSPYEPSKQPWEGNGIQSSGAYTRGLSFGNSQNVVFNSNLNLQLQGKLGNDLELQAALSDNSVPLQPDGTTRQLQEFDRIFIQIKRRGTALSAGDYDLARPAGYFSNYFKRLQGGMVQHQSIAPVRNLRGRATTTTPDTLGLRVAAAISRGKFARQLIQGQEGNQGPYRLLGAEGERFIIVLAATEKVFADGLLLQRGLDADYVIDYNLGEVSFTPKRLITKDIRIIVEFEYAVQNFLRSTLAANADWRHQGQRFFFNAYSEQDSRSPSSAQDLSPVERQRLAEAGDRLRTAFAPGVDTLAEFDPSRILYKSVDTLVCGTVQPILVYSVRPDSARYAARFTEVSAGQGNYVLSANSANGRVFRWVAPDPVTCQPRGNFEPIVRLIAPERRQLFTAGAALRPFKRARASVEMALSNRDYNRFSALDEDDNAGVALYGSWQQALLATAHWKAGLQAHYERTTRTFQPLNPYRLAEFVRDWNTGLAQDTVAEQLARAGLWIERDKRGRVSYEFGNFTRQGVYAGTRHLAQAKGQWLSLDWLAEANLLQSEGLVENTRFSRPKIDVSRLFSQKKDSVRTGLLRVGFYAEREKNERRFAAADTLGSTAFWYDLYRLYVQMPDNGRPFQLGGHLQRRLDFAPDGAFFTKSTDARELSLQGRWEPPPKSPKSTAQRLGWTLTLRDLQVLAPELSPAAAQNTYLGRVDHNLSALKNAVNLSTGYELGSGQSPKVEFNYLRVNPGEGQYAWIDRNRDSILQIDEMEISVFQDQAAYVRVAVTTADYVRTNNLVLNQNLRIEPRLWWPAPKKRWQRTLRRFSTLSTLQINRRTFANSGRVKAWNPFAWDIPDSSLVTNSSFVRNSLFLNRADPAWDASISQNTNTSQVALTTGYERRQNSEWNLHGRLNLRRRWTLEGDISRFERNSDNQAFDTRDFSIRGVDLGPKISWQPGGGFRISVASKWKNNQNRIGEGETSVQQSLQQELVWNPSAKVNAQGFRPNTSVRTKFSYTAIRYTGQPNTAVAFSMLEGLQNGKNFLWSLGFDRQITKTLQLGLQYEGRKTGSNGRLVHVARAQVRAVL
jgi:hypothetical protein